MQIIAIDNGTSGSWCIAGYNSSPDFGPMPTIEVQDYTKKVKRIKRLDVDKLADIISNHVYLAEPIRAYIERPMINPGMFNTSLLAVRALEATLICLEDLGIGYEFVDSRQWQKVMLPEGCKGKDLKTASKERAIRLYPTLETAIRKQKDGDSILMAEWAMKQWVPT